MGFFKRLLELSIWVFSFPDHFDTQQPLGLNPPDGAIRKPVLASSCVNTPTSRDCWSGDFDINTDYELKNGTPITGRTRYVSNTSFPKVSADEKSMTSSYPTRLFNPMDTRSPAWW